VNKGDREGAGEVARDLRQMLHLGEARAWDPPVVTTAASTGEGIGELWSEVERHPAWADTSGGLGAKRRARLLHEVQTLAAARFEAAAAITLRDAPSLADDLAARRIDPYAAAEELRRRVPQ
jgi:LAO/AO transport system kinase